MRLSIRFRPNVPHMLSLSDPTGEYDTGSNEVTYPTSQGELLVVSYKTACKLNALDLKPGEQFGICKRVDEQGIVTWDIWLAPQTEQQRAVEEQNEEAGIIAPAPPARPERIRAVPASPRRKPIAPEQTPFEFDRRGNGTTGPATLPAIAAASSRRPPVAARIPMNVAFVEITQFVIDGLKAVGEQWNDQAKQDMISTAIIAAQKQGLLEVWERGK